MSRDTQQERHPPRLYDDRDKSNAIRRRFTTRRNWWLLSVIVLTLIAGALRFTGLSRRDFWFDESCTFFYVVHLFDWPAGSSLLSESTNLPYYVLLRGWSWLFGHEEAAYRSFSALFATGVIPLLGWIGWRLGGYSAGLTCAALSAINPLHLHYAQEARAYALWVFLLTAVLALLVVCARSLRRFPWVAFGTVTLLCLFVHYFTLWFLPATVAAVMWAADRDVFARRWLVTMSILAAIFAPYLIFAVLPAAQGGGGAWLGEAPGFQAIFQSLWAFLPAGAYPGHLRGLSLVSVDTVPVGPTSLAHAVMLIPACVVVALAAVVLIRGRSLAPPAPTVPGLKINTAADQPAASAPGLAWDEHGRKTWSVLFALILIPLLLAWLYSHLIRPVYLIGRYDLVAWPAFTVLIGLVLADGTTVIARKSNRWIAAALILIVLACSTVPIIRIKSLQPPPTFHRVRAEWLAGKLGPADVGVAFSYDRDYLYYYLHRAGFTGRLLTFPSWLEAHVGWVDTEADLHAISTGRLQEDGKSLVEELNRTMQNGGRAYLLRDSIDPDGIGSRSRLNQVLFDSIRTAGWTTADADVRLGIIAIRKSQ